MSDHDDAFADASSGNVRLSLALGSWSSEDKGGRAGRVTREKGLTGRVNRRALRSKGRDTQLNVRTRADIKETAQRASERAGMSLIEWLEAAIEEKAAREDGHA